MRRVALRISGGDDSDRQAPQGLHQIAPPRELRMVENTGQQEAVVGGAGVEAYAGLAASAARLDSRIGGEIFCAMLRYGIVSLTEDPQAIAASTSRNFCSRDFFSAAARLGQISSCSVLTGCDKLIAYR